MLMVIGVGKYLLSGEGKQRETKGTGSPKGVDGFGSHHATRKWPVLSQDFGLSNSLHIGPWEKKKSQHRHGLCS